MEVRPLLFWFGLDGVREGLLHVVGEITHRERMREADELIFRCLERPEKYDRVLWRDEDDGAWREHFVCEVGACGGSLHEVRCESVLFESRSDFLEGFRLQEADYTQVLNRLTPYTRFAVGTVQRGSVGRIVFGSAEDPMGLHHKTYRVFRS